MVNINHTYVFIILSIEDALDEERAEDALEESNTLMQQADSSTMSGRSLILAAAHSCAGGALMLMERFDEAIVEHEVQTT